MEELQDLAGRFPITEVGSRLDDFIDTAAVLVNLDLVITCDTAVAHLAGALGVPVWVAIPFVPDWRWLLDRSDSPWYPTLRLFRQKKSRDWAGVFEEIKAELCVRLQSAGRRCRRDPRCAGRWRRSSAPSMLERVRRISSTRQSDISVIVARTRFDISSSCRRESPPLQRRSPCRFAGTSPAAVAVSYARTWCLAAHFSSYVIGRAKVGPRLS